MKWKFEANFKNWTVAFENTFWLAEKMGDEEGDTQVYSDSNGVMSEKFDGNCFFKRSAFADVRFSQIPNVSFEDAFKNAFGDKNKALDECKKTLKKRQKALATIKEKHPGFTYEDALAVMVFTYDAIPVRTGIEKQTHTEL